jgi:Fic family protein
MTTELHVPELARQILSHWMFAHIHPFDDGNGRIGRLLVPLLTRMKGATKTASALIGTPVREDKVLYASALTEARESGDWTAWTRLMLGFIANAAQQNIVLLEKLGQIADDWKSRLVRLQAAGWLVVLRVGFWH